MGEVERPGAWLNRHVVRVPVELAKTHWASYSPPLAQHTSTLTSILTHFLLHLLGPAAELHDQRHRLGPGRPLGARSRGVLRRWALEAGHQV